MPSCGEPIWTPQPSSTHPRCSCCPLAACQAAWQPKEASSRHLLLGGSREGIIVEAGVRFQLPEQPLQQQRGHQQQQLLHARGWGGGWAS